MAKKTKKVNYVQLEPAAFLSDDDFQMMSDAERGIYCTILFYMFCNNGRIKNDPKAIKRLCNVTSNFEQKWESVIPKLYQKGDWLRHRRVDSELKQANERLQTSIKAGLKGAEKRWGSHSPPNGNPVTKVSKGKVSKGKVNKEFKPPTISEVSEYCKANKLNVDCQKFMNHYEAADPPWTYFNGRDKQVPVRNWKQKLRTVWHDPAKKRRCTNSGCKEYPVYSQADDTGQVCWYCEAHKPSYKPVGLANPLKDVPLADNRSMSDKVNEQRKALGRY